MSRDLVSADVDLSCIDVLGDGILPLIDDIREYNPVHWSEASRCWIITRHGDLLDAFAGKIPLLSKKIPDVFLRFMSIDELRKVIPNTIRYTEYFSTNEDGERHQRHRRMLMKAFSREATEMLRPFIKERVAALMDVIEARGEVEFNEDVARELPGRVILELLGMPQSYHGRLKGWSDAVLIGLASNRPSRAEFEALETCFVDMAEAFRTELQARRDAPRDDLISRLLQALDGKDSPSHDEVIGTLQLLVIAGHELTTSSLALGIAALARHPDQWTKLRNEPDLSETAANELMRFSAMSAATTRIAGADFDWHGQRISKGETVVLMIAGGNRDPRVFAFPEALDINRTNIESLTFGPGLHFCVGHVLAKMQMIEFFKAVTQRFIGAEILDQEMSFKSNLVFRGVRHLNVRFLT